MLKVGLGDLKTTPKALESERSGDGNSMRKVLAETEREQIVRALEQANWVISGAAAKLGMKRSTLQARMQKLGIQNCENGRQQLDHNLAPAQCPHIAYAVCFTRATPWHELERSSTLSWKSPAKATRTRLAEAARIPDG